MAWEQRGNNQYYYRKRREGNRVISEYIGKGSTAQLIAALDLDDRMERRYKRNQIKNNKNDMKKMNKDVDQVSRLVNGFLRTVLLTSGYHPHKGQWRKIRYE